MSPPPPPPPPPPPWGPPLLAWPCLNSLRYELIKSSCCDLHAILRYEVG